MSSKIPVRKKEEIVQEPHVPFLSFKKPWIWLILVVVAAAAVLTVWLLTRPPISTEMSDELDAFVVSTLREQHYSDHTGGKYPAVAYSALCVEEEKNGEITVYGVMMYSEYTCTTDNKLQKWGSANTPFAITAKPTDTGYELVECWWPKSGKNYVSSIQEKFPQKVRASAVNAQQYIAYHTGLCETAALQNITDAEKYTVLQSERDNVRLAYCAGNTYAYVLFGAGGNTDGTYAVEGDKATFTFGKTRLVFAVEGDSYTYKAEESVDVPAEWGTIGDTTYLEDGVVFTPEGSEPAVEEDTAPVGPTVMVSNNTHMDETALREMFGQYVPSTFFDSENPTYFPVRPIETRAQLERFIEAYGAEWSGLTIENFAQYDEAFFEENFLLITYYKDGMAACEPSIDSYVYVQDGTSLWLSVRMEVEKPTVGDTVVGQWLLFSGIAKEDYKKANALEAYVKNVVTVAGADASAADTLSFTGTVKQVEGNAVLMETDDVEQFSSGVWVELGEAELDPMVGETYTVTYEDIVMPSLPPRITAVTITKP